MQGQTTHIPEAPREPCYHCLCWVAGATFEPEFTGPIPGRWKALKTPKPTLSSSTGFQQMWCLVKSASCLSGGDSSQSERPTPGVGPSAQAHWGAASISSKTTEGSAWFLFNDDVRKVWQGQRLGTKGSHFLAYFPPKPSSLGPFSASAQIPWFWSFMSYGTSSDKWWCKPGSKVPGTAKDKQSDTKENLCGLSVLPDGTSHINYGT